MAGVDEVIRQWVQKVEKTGELRNIAGFGKPFNFKDGFLETPNELRMAYKILKDAGYVPAEVEMVQRLATLREQLDATQGEAAAARAADQNRRDAAEGDDDARGDARQALTHRAASAGSQRNRCGRHRRDARCRQGSCRRRSPMRVRAFTSPAVR